MGSLFVGMAGRMSLSPLDNQQATCQRGLQAYASETRIPQLAFRQAFAVTRITRDT